MANVTTCTDCGRAYEAANEEAANEAVRLCARCRPPQDSTRLGRELRELARENPEVAAAEEKLDRTCAELVAKMRAEDLRFGDGHRYREALITIVSVIGGRPMGVKVDRYAAWASVVANLALHDQPYPAEPQHEQLKQGACPKCFPPLGAADDPPSTKRPGVDPECEKCDGTGLVGGRSLDS